MKKVLLAGVAYTAMSMIVGTASAADMAVKAPVYKAAPTTVPNWTGFYIGGGGGYGMWNQESYLETDPSHLALSSSNTNGGRGWFGIVTAGFDYQFNQSIVAGVFADWAFSDIKGTSSIPVLAVVGNESQKSSWAVGGRIGWLVTPSVLTYFNGGYTQTHFDAIPLFTAQSLPSTALGISAVSATYGGWFLGGGLEYQLSFLPGFSLRTEYRYADYGAKDLPTLGNSEAINAHKFSQSVLTELTYKFNTGGRAVAPVSNVAPARAVNWTGFYLGGGGGYGMWNQESIMEFNPSHIPLSPSNTNGGRGWFGTVTAGFDYQFNQNIVAGLFADRDFSNINGTLSIPEAVWTGAESQNWSWAVGGRIGWLVTPSVLTYFNGGYTQTHFNSVSLLFPVIPTVPIGQNLAAANYDGWFLGSGFEYQLSFMPGLSVRTEYRYADYGSKDVPIVDAVTGIPNDRALNNHKYTQSVRTELTYKFGGPVAAKY
jgi:outer membrane immunogenic protein